MKCLPFCCLLLLLSMICHRGHSASLGGNEIKAPEHPISESQWGESDALGPLLRTKREPNLHICIYCCNCCKKQKGCGMCCRT
ncbi:hepcidin [Xenopus laevis]|uniref:Hepcidin n=1 Tax=Xenopus laevis TaxID=8355 RepID=A0A8J0U6E6_XENLA|nr:hepcidin [Xenopus laevis]